MISVDDNLTVEQKARKGVLHLLATRYMRLLRHDMQKKHHGEHIGFFDEWVDRGMLEDKIAERLTSPQIKAYLLDSFVPRDEVMRENPYYEPSLTREMVKEEIDQLLVEHKIAPTPSILIQGYYDERKDALSNVPTYSITDMGMNEMRTYWPNRLREMNRFTESLKNPTADAQLVKG